MKLALAAFRLLRPHSNRSSSIIVDEIMSAHIPAPIETAAVSSTETSALSHPKTLNALAVMAGLTFFILLAANADESTAQTIQWADTAEGFAIVTSQDSVESQQTGLEQRLAALREQLKESQIEPTPAGITSFMRSLVPSQSQQELVRQLISQLGNDSYQIREKATQRLISISTLQAQDLQEAIDGSDIETRWRAIEISNARREGVVERQVASCLSYISLSQMPGMLEPILIAYKEMPSTSIEYSARTAITATLSSEAPAALQPLLSDSSADLRWLGMRTAIDFSRTERPDKTAFEQLVDEQLARLENDASPKVRLLVAETLAQRKDRNAFPILMGLISESITETPGERTRERRTIGRIADRSASILRQVTGANLKYSSYSSPDEQKKSAEQWKNWLAENGETCELFDLGLRIQHGRTLVCSYSPGHVYELDESGKVIWEMALPSAFACVGLENGNRLIAQYSQGRIVEYNPAGTLVWEVSGLPGNLSGISRTDSNTTLVAAGQAENQLFEIDESGARVWDIKVEGTPVHAIRLDNGLTLVSLMNGQRVIEIDREGKEIWELKVDSQPYHAQRLENGNTLVRFSRGGAAEYSREGTKVWSVECSNGYSVQRLDDGTTLIADSEGFRVVDFDGNVIEENKNYTGYLYVHRY